MSRSTPILGLLGWSLLLLAGCHPQQPFYFNEKGDLSHYRGMATEIEYPDVDAASLGDVHDASAPMTLNNQEPREMWDLTLEEAMQIALTNSKVMRQIGAAAVVQPGGQGPQAPDFLLRNPLGAPTVYEPAIVESDPRFGTEAALSAFDAQLSSTMLWEKRNTPVNSIYTVPPFNFVANPSLQDLGTFQSRLQKTAATGGTFAVNHNVTYTNDNSPSRLAPNDYLVTFDMEARQPLLQGAGVAFNRIAGPNAFPGFNSGIMIARVNSDIALATFEANVRNLVSDVESTYWELYFTYRNLDSVVAGRDSALQTWRRIYALSTYGAKGGEAEREAQAREQYFLFRSTVERSLNALYKAEANLRYMLGIAATDGRLIRPKDEPTTALVKFDWHSTLNEGLVRNVELRQQKWVTKKRELEVIAAKNYLLPRLDATARYRWLGLGDEMIGPGEGVGDPAAALAPYAYNNMFGGQHQGWALGLEFRMPLGFRKEMAGVRNAQLQLARERAVLQEQELELSHQLAAAVRDLEANHVLSATNFNRRIAAQRQVEAVKAAYDTDTVTIDVLLNAQRLLAQAESDYYRSLADYNKSITQVHFRKGSLLEYNGVFLAEGPWPGKAYFDATRLARARDAGHYMDYGFTLPRVVSRGTYAQQAGVDEAILPEMTPTPAVPTPAVTPETVPTPPPSPTPASQSQTRAAPASGQSAAKAATAVVKASGPQPKSRDLADSGLGALVTSSGKGNIASGVRPVAYEQAISTEGNPSGGTAARQAEKGWTSAKASKAAHEPVANPTTAALDQSASGWKRAQH